MEQVTLKLAETSHLGRAGEVITLSLSPSDVHDPTEMPAYLAGYYNSQYRADQVSPVILVDKDEDKYRTFDPRDTFQRVAVKSSLNAYVREVDPRTSLTNYKVIDRFIGSFVNDVTEANAGSNASYRPRQAAARRCGKAILLDREIDVWSMLKNTASWSAGVVTTLGAGFQWNGGANKAPLQDLFDMQAKSDQQITDFWMGQIAAQWFLRDAEVRAHMRQMLGDAAVADAVRSVNDARGPSKVIDFAISGLAPIHVVAGRVLNESTGVNEPIIGNDVIGTVQPEGGTPTDGEEIASTYTFRRRGNAGNGWESREYRIENRGPRGGTMVVAALADIAVLTGPSVGGLLKNAIQ